MKTIKVNRYFEIPTDYTGIVEWWDGTKEWWLEGKWHREDGPAFESSNRKEWHLNNSYYKQINLKNYVVLDYYKGKYNLIWYKLLDEDEIFEHPDIPGLITK